MAWFSEKCSPSSRGLALQETRSIAVCTLREVEVQQTGVLFQVALSLVQSAGVMSTRKEKQESLKGWRRIISSREDFSNRGGGGSCGTFLLSYTKQVQNLSFSREAPVKPPQNFGT